MHHYKSIVELRKESGINQFLHTVIRKECTDDDIASYIINEAYRLVIVYIEDSNPLADPYYSYINEINYGLQNYKDLVLFVFCKMLELQTALPADARLIGTNFDKAQEFVKILKNDGGETFDLLLFENPTERQLSLGEWSIITPPTPPDQLGYFTNEWEEVTKDFDQETIRKIIFRYQTKEDQLAILQKIRNVYNGDDDGLPF